MRLANATLSQAWQKWKQTSATMNLQQHALSDALCKLQNRQLSAGFNTWRALHQCTPKESTQLGHQPPAHLRDSVLSRITGAAALHAMLIRLDMRKLIVKWWVECQGTRGAYLQLPCDRAIPEEIVFNVHKEAPTVEAAPSPTNSTVEQRMGALTQVFLTMDPESTGVVQAELLMRLQDCLHPEHHLTTQQKWAVLSRMAGPNASEVTLHQWLTYYKCPVMCSSEEEWSAGLTDLYSAVETACDGMLWTPWTCRGLIEEE